MFTKYQAKKVKIRGFFFEKSLFFGDALIASPLWIWARQDPKGGNFRVCSWFVKIRKSRVSFLLLP